MNWVLVTNHKGAVGKTFVSVHLAKCLADEGLRVLLVDCDGQYDAFRFFHKKHGKPTSDKVEQYVVDQMLEVLANAHGNANEKPLSLKQLHIEEDQYDYVLIDSDACMVGTVKHILQNQIKLVLAPVNFQGLSIVNLEDLFKTVGTLYGLSTPFEDTPAAEMAAKIIRPPQAGRPRKGERQTELFPDSPEVFPDTAEVADPDNPKDFPDRTETAEAGNKTLRNFRKVAREVAAHIIVVPLAADSQALAKQLKRFRVKTKVQTMTNMPWLREESDQSLTQGKLIWEVPTLSPDQQAMTRQFFVDLAGKVKQYFRLEEA